MLMRLREPRINKRIDATLESGTGTIENISASGGFLKTREKISTGDNFDLELKVRGGKLIKLVCAARRNEKKGIGFEVVSIKGTKEQMYHQYITKQFESIKKFGDSRVFTDEIMVTLKDTNAFGNVYFSNFIQYQGVIREKFLLETVPSLHQLLAETGIRLVTVDAYNKYISNAYFGDTIVAELTTSSIQAASCKLNITFKNKETGVFIGKGYQTFCVVKSNGKVVRIPEELLEPLDFYQKVLNH